MQASRDGQACGAPTAQAAIALENSRLYGDAQTEIEERKQAQTQQSLLIRELHHRVKNTLATVQSIAAQTLRAAGGDLSRFTHAFGSRLQALSVAHNLLTRHSWGETDLAEVVQD